MQRERRTKDQQKRAFSAGNLGTVNQGGGGNDKAEDIDDGPDEAGADEKDIQPVGQEYIEENKSDDGKIISFNCKLCECRFNDPNAKDMHMKGRRHRFAYKKKVNPDLVVDMKPSLKVRLVAVATSAPIGMLV